MSGRLGTAATAATAAATARPALFVFLDIVPGPLRAWSGIGAFAWAGATWTGTGTLGQVSAIEETMELRAAGAQVALSGVPGELLAGVIATPVQGKAARIWLAFMSEAWTLLEEPVLVFSGRIDTLEAVDGGATAVITLAVENRLRDLERAPLRRYTDADQQSEYPGDRGFAFLPSLQNRDIEWGGPA